MLTNQLIKALEASFLLSSTTYIILSLRNVFNNIWASNLEFLIEISIWLYLFISYFLTSFRVQLSKFHRLLILIPLKLEIAKLFLRIFFCLIFERCFLHKIKSRRSLYFYRNLFFCHSTSSRSNALLLLCL